MVDDCKRVRRKGELPHTFFYISKTSQRHVINNSALHWKIMQKSLDFLVL